MIRNALPALLYLSLNLGCSPGAEVTNRGERAFENYCAPCHLADGRGVEGGGPPLAGSAWVKGSQARLIRIVLHGLRGPVQVGERTYNREMLAFGPILSDREISDILTFVRRRFGEGAPAVTPEAVGQARRESTQRTTYWTMEELLRLP